MGLLSNIGKAFKKVFSGIMIVFQPILEPIAKALSSDLGKAIMIGLSIFTLGTAFIAAQGAYAAAASIPGSSFVQAFVAGGKQFLQTMVTGKGFEGGAQTAATSTEAATTVMQQGAQNTAQALETGGVPGIVGQTGPEAAGSMAMGPGPTGDVMNAAVQSGGSGAGGGAFGPGELAGGIPETAEAASTAANLTKKTTDVASKSGGGWLEKAKEMGKGFIDYTKTEGGAQMVGTLIGAAGDYYTEKDRQEFEDRIRRQWGKGEGDAGIRSMRDTEARVGRLEGPSAQGIARQSRTTARDDGQRPQYLLPAGG